MKNYFMVSQTDGALYDTRVNSWHLKPELRPNFQRVLPNCENNSQAIRAAIRTAFAFPGGYELFGITSDGACLCNKCMNSEYRQIAYSVKHQVNDGWRIVGIESAGNTDGPIYCDHCSAVIVED